MILVVIYSKVQWVLHKPEENRKRAINSLGSGRITKPPSEGGRNKNLTPINDFKDGLLVIKD